MKPENEGHGSQLERFKKAARELGCDESEANFEAALKRVARHRPVQGKSSEKPKREQDGDKNKG